MSPQMIICIIVLICTMISFILNKLPMALTAITAALVLMITGCISANDLVSNFANTNGIMMVSMFVCAAGLNRTKLVKHLSGLVTKVGKGSFTVCLAGYVLIAALLGQFIGSSMVVYGIVAPLVLGMCEDCKVSPSKAMLSIGMVSICCLSILPIGGSLTGYAKNNGYLETYQYTTYQFQMFDSFKSRFPILIVAVLLAIFVVPKLCPDIKMGKVDMEGKKLAEQKPLPPVQEFLGYAIFIATTLGMVFADKLHMATWQVCLIGAVLMVLSGVLTENEAIGAMHINFWILYVGALTLGTGLSNSGADILVGDFVAKLAGNTHNSYVIGGIFFLVPFVLTQFMQNRTVGALFPPIAIMACKALGCNPVGPVLLCQTGSLLSFMTPAATPTVAMMMGNAGYSVKDLFKSCLIPALILGVVAVGWTMTLFPAF